MPGKLQERLPQVVNENNTGEVITTEISAFGLIDSPSKNICKDLSVPVRYSNEKLDLINLIRRKRWHS